jgi:hypothetical protein
MRLSIVLGVLLYLIGFSVSAQKTAGELVTLKAGRTSFPVDPARGSSDGIVLRWSLLSAPDIAAYRTAMGYVNHKVFSMPLASLFSYNYCYLPERLLQKRFDVLVAQRSYSGDYYLWVDENGDKDFTDETSQAILPGKPLFREIKLVLDSVTSTFALPLQFDLTGRGKNTSLAVSNLLKFHLDYDLKDTMLQLDLLVNYYAANFSLPPAADIPGVESRPEVYLLEEPFPFAGRFFMLRKLDILNKTVELALLPPGQLPYGYKKGYYAEVDRVIKLLDNAVALTECRAKNQAQDYLLLYFWMYWSQPCIDQFGELSQIAEMLDKSGRATMLCFPVLRNLPNQEKEIAILKKKISTYALPCRQFLETAGSGSCGVPYSNRKTVKDMLDVVSFPTYILLNKEGQIIYRGENKHHELQALLKELGLWNE